MKKNHDSLQSSFLCSLNASGTLPTPEARIGLGPEARNYVAYIPVPLNDDEDEGDDEDDEYYDDEDYEDEVKQHRFNLSLNSEQP